VPNLRFPEFNKEWKKRKLSDFLTFKNGINASKESYGSGYKFINVLDIIENDFITHQNIIGAVKISEEVFNKNIVEYGDILFQRSSETREDVGQSNVYLDKKVPATFGGFVIRGKRIKDYNPLFLNYLLKTSPSRKEITSKSGGSTRYNIGQDTLSSVGIITTELKEQAKIASFLLSIEGRIQTQNKIIEDYKLFKKGMMQQLFQQEIRFKEEGENYPKWEIKRLDSIAHVVKGKQLNKQELTENGTYLCQNGGIEPSGYTEEYNTTGETITISEGGNSCGYVNYIRDKFWCGGHCYSLLNIASEMINLFLYQYLKFHQSKIMSLRVGSGLPNIQKKDIVNFKIILPCKEEQQKIAKVLSDIDRKIELETKIVALLNQQKQYFLQNLFI
ncbi:restriction endonuclease subunit S, partial [Mesonia sp. K4-1]|uniref:restriction endonuclease subunit S n=1 Tax=Mesonia sp. K4-1 TaxID=2602760 RepID=UPI0011CA73C4